MTGLTHEAEDMLGSGLRTIREAQEFTRLSRGKLYQLMELGALPYTTIGRRRLIPYRALIELAAHGLNGGGRELEAGTGNRGGLMAPAHRGPLRPKTCSLDLHAEKSQSSKERR